MPIALLTTASLALLLPAAPTVEAEVDARFSNQPTQRVIVRVEDPLGGPHPATISKKDRATRVAAHRRDLAARKAKILRAAGAQLGRRLEVHREYPAFPLFAIDADRALVAAIAAQPGVSRVLADGEVRPQLQSSLPHMNATTFHESRGRGAGTAVAILDSPVRYEGGHFGTCPRPGAAGCNFSAQLNFTGQNIEEVKRIEDRFSGSSHGTNVAAIAHGVAPEADIIGLSVFTAYSDGRLRASNSDVLDALNWVAFAAAAENIVAANMSLGSEREDPGACDGHGYADAIRTLYYDYDVLTVISSGNDATQNSVGSPACVSLAVTVAAHFDTETARYAGYDCYQEDPRDQEMACFSNLNGLVDLVAPGVFVEAGGYRLSGTSMAAPHVTGAVALLQGDFLSTEGDTRSAKDANRRLMLSAGRLIHIDGRIFPRLDVAASGAWDRVVEFAEFARPGPERALTPGETRTFSVDLPSGPALAGGYLYLSLEHPAPDTLNVTLSGPGGVSARIPIPGEQANFTGVIGRQFATEALAELAGAAAGGTWTLSVEAPTGEGSGAVFAASLLLRNEGCTPECTDAGCGDDGCGGRCEAGGCEINQRCYAAGSVPHENPCLMCDPSISTSSWGRSGNGCQIEGTCFPAGQPFDTIPCMSCRPEVSTSGWSPNAGFCVVAGGCIAAGDKRPGSTCRGCDPEQDPRAYSNLTGVSCDDEDACTADDVCSAGRCEGTPVECPAPGPCEENVTCAATSGDCTSAPKPDGTACGESGVCAAGVCTVAEGGGEDSEGCSSTGSNPLGLLLLAGLIAVRRGQRGAGLSAPR